MSDNVHPPKPARGRLADFWDQAVSKLVSIEFPALDAGEVERHRIYSLALMALVAEYWNGNKNGKEGEYPWRKGQRRADQQYEGGDYLGHNIACIAVDAQGDVIDFDFNHNEVFNSSVEHAESRLIRRVFSLTQIHDGWVLRGPDDPPPSLTYATQLNQVTIYTSLESCSQCSGIMALGSVRRVVFLQRDPGQNSVGNILRNLSPPGASFAPPLPIPADLLGIPYFEQLAAAYADFEAKVRETPFHISPTGAKSSSPSITSFLCTDAARAIFNSGRDELASLTLTHPDYVPQDDRGVPVAGGLHNRTVLERVRGFVGYAVKQGDRGTPHRV